MRRRTGESVGVPVAHVAGAGASASSAGATRQPVGDVAAPATAPHALRSVCPVANTLDVLGDRWTLLVIRDLFSDKRRFGDFLASPEHIPSNILADRLKRLERAGLIAHALSQLHPPRVEYHLTPRGRELRPILDAMATWGLSQFPGTRRPARLTPPPPAESHMSLADEALANSARRASSPRRSGRQS